MGKNRVKKFMEKNGQQADYEFFNPSFVKVRISILQVHDLSELLTKLDPES